MVGAAGSASAATTALPATPDLGGVTALDGAHVAHNVDATTQHVTGMAGDTGGKAVKKAVPAAGKAGGKVVKTAVPVAQKTAGEAAGQAAGRWATWPSPRRRLPLGRSAGGRSAAALTPHARRARETHATPGFSANPGVSRARDGSYRTGRAAAVRRGRPQPCRSRATAAWTLSSVAVRATRTKRSPAGP